MRRINNLLKNSLVVVILCCVVTITTKATYSQVTSCAGEPAGTHCLYYNSSDCINGCYGGPNYKTGPPACNIDNNFWECDGNGSCSLSNDVDFHSVDSTCSAITPTATPTQSPTQCSGYVLGFPLSCKPAGYLNQSCGTGTYQYSPVGGICTGYNQCFMCETTGVNNPTATPSDTPTPTTSSPPPGGGGPPPGGGGPPPVVVPPTATPVVPTATPTPPFDQSMCSCDGLNFSSIIAGQPLSVTAYGKVLSANTQYATIPSFDFIFYQGSGTQATIVTKATEKADIFATLPDKVRFKSDWTLNVPANLDPTLTYRIQAKPTCVRKVAAVSNIEENRVVLGASTDNSLWGKIMSFFADLFGGGEKTLPATQTNNFAANYSAVTPTEAVKKQNLQLDTFHPANILDSDNCSFIKFGF